MHLKRLPPAVAAIGVLTILALVIIGLVFENQAVRWGMYLVPVIIFGGYYLISWFRKDNPKRGLVPPAVDKDPGERQ